MQIKDPIQQSDTNLRPFPNPVAVFDNRFCFTTLSPKEVPLGPYAHPTSNKPCHLFTLDAELYYTPFKYDYGPLNLAYTFEACVKIHDKMNARHLFRRPICLYTGTSPNQKANLAVIVSLYALIVKHFPPWEALMPLHHIELISFRDAGNGDHEFGLSAQDIVWGMWKARKNKLVNFPQFDAVDYRHYEKVENGDLNIIGNFIPFASPIDPLWVLATRRPNRRRTVSSKEASKISDSFNKLLDKFKAENVGLVVRLNDELYDRSRFTEEGIDHVEMYFDDGSNPSDRIVRHFFSLVDDVIGRSKKVAVHCKAGLGRTGVLIGAYLIYKYHFTAPEAIGFMRIIRPGMVVGPQQRYMLMNQMKWSGWAANSPIPQQHVRSTLEDTLESSPIHDRSDHSSLPAAVLLSTDQEFSMDSTRPLTPMRRLPAPTSKSGDQLGQPRKTSGQSVALSSQPNDFELSNIGSQTSIQSDVEPLSDENRAITQSILSPVVRGKKRGSGRVPVPDCTKVDHPSLRTYTIEDISSVEQDNLMRSDSNVSSVSNTSELDHRASKRRPEDLSPFHKIGLNSPPPSRETTPREGSNESKCQPLVPTEDSVVDVEKEQTLSIPLSALAATNPEPVVTSNPSELRRRSFIPTLKAAPPMKDTKPVLMESKSRNSRPSLAAAVHSKTDSHLSSGAPYRTATSTTAKVWDHFSRLKKTLDC